MTKTKSTGPRKNIQQQREFLNDNNALDTWFRTLFYTDLFKIIQDNNKPEDHFIIIGNFNEPLLDNQYVTKDMSERGLTNAIKYIHRATPATQTTGTYGIDHIWMSNSILQHVRACGYLEYTAGLPSDHRSIYIDLDISFQNDMEFANYQKRLLVSTNYFISNKYRASVMRQYKKRNIATQIDDLRALSDTLPHNFCTEFNRVDKLITNILILVER